MTSRRNAAPGGLSCCAGATTRQDTPGGLRVALPLDPELAGQLARLATAEQSCCSFLQFGV
ncbi:hypothetical protein [Pseudonocardia sp. GCM10023141]|uniref:hypothetical protein n=1 Tax=Pseudonocardia sp. GCM10023141 TaxID=3252653 RepID=UPI00360C5BD3